MTESKDPSAPTDTDEELDRRHLATLTVLYAEDDTTTRELLARILGRRVGRVVVAADGAEGLARFSELRPDLVVTDILMPQMDGLVMAGHIRRLDARVPIIVTTAFEQVDYLQRSIDAGVDRYVTKPVDTHRLEAALLHCARQLRADALLATQRQNQLRDAQRHTWEALGLLAGGMAHDFNNLLQSILGNLSLAMVPSLPPDQKDFLADAYDAARQASALGHGLFTLAQGGVLAAVPVPLETTLRAAVGRAAGAHRTLLTLSLADNLPAVMGDVELLSRAFSHLALNAMEAMAGGGTLTVTGTARTLSDGEVPGLAPGRFLELCFRDTGPGIAPDILPRVFDPYFTTKERGSVRGVGLGLALCQAILRKHQGLVTAESSPGEGACFRVFLPTPNA